MPDISKPNLLFILVDQLRFDTMSCAGSPFVKTPNMDRLAREGVRFTNAITPSPICAPARAAILTGQPIHTTGCVTNLDLQGGRCDGLRSFDHLLADNGYKTEYVGRWHAPESMLSCYPKRPMSPNMDEYRDYLTTKGYEPVEQSEENPFVCVMSGQPYDPDPVDHGVRVRDYGHGHDRVEPGLTFGRDTIPQEHSLSTAVADEAIDALSRLKDEPFSLTSSFMFPHHPLIVPRPWCDMINEADLVLPETFDDTRENTQYDTFTWHMDEVERKHARLIMARYFAAVQEVDHHIGRVLDTLDGLGLTDNTLVIFTSDHGEMLGDHGLKTKFVHYRESVGVPLILRMPGVIEAGRTAATPTCLTDLYATITDYLGVESLQCGESLRSLIDGDDPDTDRIVFSQQEHWNVMARTRDWKYVWSSQPDQVDMLFDLANDPVEVTNLLGRNPDRDQYSEPAGMMKRHLTDWMEETDHPWYEQAVSSDVR
jgi:arylsulfatase A-like enzyme